MSDNAQNQGPAQSLRDKKLHELISAEYKYLTEQFIANEEMGEKRVALFVSLTAGLGAAAVLAREKLANGSSVSFPEVFVAVNVAWLLFGYLTFLRIIHRNVTTDKYKRQLRKLREWFVEEGDAAARVLIPYDPYGPPDKRRKGLTFCGTKGGNGGYAELVGLINSVIAGTLGWQVTHYAIDLVSAVRTGAAREGNLFALVIAMLVAWFAWKWQGRHAKQRYQE